MPKLLFPVALAIFLGLTGATSVIAQSDNLQENKKIALKAIDFWKSDSKIDPSTIFAPNYVNNLDSAVSPDLGKQKRNLKEFEAEVTKFRAAFKDLKVLNSMQVAEGNMVATHVTVSAKHVGSFMGETPTNKTITWDCVEFVKIENGKIVETWVTWDKYDFLKQIGILK
ncbi:ester cyclase [Microbulbifer sp. MLAF003]|uniref:ester cyclase n=1 Tax=unclassified Microbulbifer TaxID=2619833 RepID=UPI0024AD8D2A|nr:ester cyclase [Microbulbifer sp. MLAF003]WHI52834.1 ester cyclase [Microbulbifer sp. MLAF003]